MAPIVDLTILPLTGWFLEDADNQGLAQVNINGIVASESVLVKDGVTKYSFSLLNYGCYESFIKCERCRVGQWCSVRQ